MVKKLTFLFFTLFFCFLNLLTLAQNAADSDLSNSADTNKNWRGFLWPIAIIVLLVVVFIVAYRRRRREI